MELKIKMPTKDEFEEMYKNFYKETAEDVCNISYWFPKIENCGIKVPRTFIKKVPIEIAKLFTLEQPDDIDKIIAWTKEEIEPLIKNLGRLPFIKNGCFSNKFDFKSAIPHSNYLDVARSIMDIMYQAISDGEYTIRLSGLKPTLGECVVDIVKNDEYYPEYWR